MNPLHSLLYTSRAVTEFLHAELQQLLAKSRENNSTLGITGMLLYRNGRFMQVIEGDQSTVRTLKAKIELDPRHRDFVVLLDGPVASREFPDWSMGFADISDDPSKPSEALGEFLHLHFASQEFKENPSLAKRLLLSFKQNSL